MKEVSVGPNLSTLEFQALETKNTQLKEELTVVRIKNDSLRDENVSIKKRYQDLYQSKAESNSNVSSGAAVPEKPKVLAPGLYAMMPKNKSITEASMSKSKCGTKTHRNLPARSENVKRVDNPLRNLNKRNRVDSSLSVTPSSRNISPDPPDNLSKYLFASLAISPFHDVKAYNALANKPPIPPQDPISPPTILTPSSVLLPSPLFDP
nr:hypothetical protein [Tanacetum cinerariifolium]